MRRPGHGRTNRGMPPCSARTAISCLLATLPAASSIRRFRRPAGRKLPIGGRPPAVDGTLIDARRRRKKFRPQGGGNRVARRPAIPRWILPVGSIPTSQSVHHRHTWGGALHKKATRGQTELGHFSHALTDNREGLMAHALPGLSAATFLLCLAHGPLPLLGSLLSRARCFPQCLDHRLLLLSDHQPLCTPLQPFRCTPPCRRGNRSLVGLFAASRCIHCAPPQLSAPPRSCTLAPSSARCA